MKQRRTILWVVVGAWVIPGALATAQVGAGTCPDDEAIDNLRAGRPTNLDQPIIDNWVTVTLDQLKAAAASDPAGTRAFVECFKTQYTNGDNSIDFKRMLAERCAALFQPEITQAGGDGTVPWALADVLLAFAAEPARETLLAGLSSVHQVVRHQCAKALAAIRPEVTVDARLTGVTVQAIAAAGAKESNDVVAAMMYEACNYPEHPDESATAIITIMRGRLAALRDNPRDIGRAELHAVRVLDALTLNNALKPQAVAELAPLLRICVERYAQADIPEDERFAIQDTIDEAESLIRKLVNPSDGPNISEKMQRGGDAAPIDMQIELIEWIGDAQSERVLNRNPWNVPRGAP